MSESTSEVSTNTTPTPDLETSYKIAKLEYVAAMSRFHQLTTLPVKGNKRASARNVKRAVMAAVDYGITDSHFKIVSTFEAELAGLFAKILDLRTILQAEKVNKQKEQKENLDESKVSEPG